MARLYRFCAILGDSIAHSAFLGEQHQALVAGARALCQHLAVDHVDRVFLFLGYAGLASSALLFLTLVHRLETQVETKQSGLGGLQVGDLLGGLLAEVVLNDLLQDLLREVSLEVLLARYGLPTDIVLLRKGLKLFNHLRFTL